MGDVNKNSMREVFHNEKFSQFRQQILSGELPESCRFCKEMESVGLTSNRQNVNLRFKNETLTFSSLAESLGTLPFYRPKFLDIRFSNFCNLKCRSCGPLASTSWGREEGEGLYELKEDIQKEAFSLVPHLSEIYFAGGEPLIMKENLFLLEEMKKKNSDIRIVYNTNLSTLNFHGKDYLEEWKGLKNISIIASFDEVGEQAEYLRSGLRFTSFLQNAHKLVDAKIFLEFHVVVSVINVFSIRKMIKFLSEEFPHQGVHYTLLTTPTLLRISVLPQDLRQHLINDLIQLQKEAKEAHHPILKLMLHELGLDHTEYLPQTLSYLRELDRRRGESFKQFFPAHPLAALI